MPKMDMTAAILRATDLLWRLAISDAEDYFKDRIPMLHDLTLLAVRSRAQSDLRRICRLRGNSSDGLPNICARLFGPCMIARSGLNSHSFAFAVLQAAIPQPEGEIG